MRIEIKKEHSAILCDCKSCNKPISINAKICPNCGTNDPFYFEEVKKTSKSNERKFMLSELIFILGALGFYSFINGVLWYVLVLGIGTLIHYIWMRINEKWEEDFYDKIVTNRKGIEMGLKCISSYGFSFCYNIAIL